MAKLINPKIPTSVRDAKGTVGSMAGTAVAGLTLLGGIGLGVMALPHIMRVPAVGRVFGAGVGFVRPQENNSDAFGGF